MLADIILEGFLKSTYTCVSSLLLRCLQRQNKKIPNKHQKLVMKIQKLHITVYDILLRDRAHLGGRTVSRWVTL